MHLSERGDGVTERLQRVIAPDLRHAHPGTDIRAVVDGYVSISPLDTTLAHPEHARQLEASADTLFTNLAGA
jgi:broad specificity polyphosphatase/5'/3'-nucleotidase SurE